MIPAIARRFGGERVPAPAGTWRPLWPILAFLIFLASGWAISRFVFPVGPNASLISKILLTQGAALVTAVFIVGVAVSHGGVRALGFSRIRARDPIWAGASYLAILPVYFLAGIVWSIILRKFGVEAPTQEVLRELPALQGTDLVVVICVVVLIGPFFEELLFRGFLQPSLQRSLGDRTGWILSSICFALVHDLIAILPIFFLGLLFGYLYRRSGRIWVSWIAHALHNGIMVALLVGLPELNKALGG